MYIMTKLVNLTPHTVNIFNEDGELKFAIEKSKDLAVPRCSQKNIKVGEINGAPIYKMEFGAVEGLPPVVDGTIYIVSRMVITACPDRKDLVSPGPLLRNEAGQPIGAVGLSI